VRRVVRRGVWGLGLWMEVGIGMGWSGVEWKGRGVNP